MKYGRWLVGCGLVLWSLLGSAAQPLPPDQAFHFSTVMRDSHTVVARWAIAPGYYLYRDHFNFSLLGPNGRLGTISLPPGIPKQDEFMGKYQVYENSVAVTLPLVGASAGPVSLKIGYQGCSAAGFCYPPVTKQIDLTLKENFPLALASAAPPTPPQQDRAMLLLANSNVFLILLGFFGFGLLLAFTPCVLPMVPILSGIILGQTGSMTVARAFSLSLAYVIAMATTYALAGVGAGLLGSYVQAFFQNPWIIGIFSLVFVLLSLSLFGLYELRLPQRWQHHLTHVSNRQTRGKHLGVVIMGALSALIVSPCVTAPLIGALSYIGKTGNAVLGGSALFSLGVGMGVPLLVVGTMGGKFLPKAGVWMHSIKVLFGILLLAVAISLLSRVISPVFTVSLWAILFIGIAVGMGLFLRRVWRATSLIPLLYGILLFIGIGFGNTDPLWPLSLRAGTFKTVTSESPFRVVKDLPALQQALANARAQAMPVMVDFYADWCVSCKHMDRFVFTDPKIQQEFKRFILLRVDLTANNDADRAITKQFGVIAPPTMLFFDCNGQEFPSSRIVGELSAQELYDTFHRFRILTSASCRI